IQPENDDRAEPSAPPRAGRCAIVGRPNVGKSTLLNALLGQKLVIATPRPGTTRAAVLGVYVSDSPRTQIAFVDTPGLHRPKSALGKVLVEQARTGLQGADLILFLVEAPGRHHDVQISPADEEVLRLLSEESAPVVVAINKMDRLEDKRRMLPLMQLLQERLAPAALVPISAIKRQGLDTLLEELRKLLPEGLLYDEDVLTDRPERFFVAEFVREAAIRQTREEVPHGVAVVIERFEQVDRHTHIAATLIVEKDSHKGIVIGKGGARLKQIGIRAREDIERFLERKVFLELWVKVIPGWTGNPAEARRLVLEGGS
ncbi:MAG: GTPase Era, partial [Myxococcales bacterium]|nr:GTPase Era [Myxococcales bacterium]